MVVRNPYRMTRILDAAPARIDPIRYSANVQLIRFSPPNSPTALGMVVAVSNVFVACSHMARHRVNSRGRC